MYFFLGILPTLCQQVWFNSIAIYLNLVPALGNKIYALLIICLICLNKTVFDKL